VNIDEIMISMENDESRQWTRAVLVGFQLPEIVGT